MKTKILRLTGSLVLLIILIIGFMIIKGKKSNAEVVLNIIKENPNKVSLTIVQK